MKFFSNQFARRKKYSDNEYIISSAYSNYMLAAIGLAGVAYPSVASAYEGQNIVLKPEIADQFIELEILGMSLFERKNFQNLPVACFKTCTDLGKDNKDFVWKDV